MNKKIKLTIIICSIFVASMGMIIFVENLENIELSEQSSGIIDMDKAIADHKAQWEIINERTNNRATSRDLDWAMNQTNNDFDKSMELINNYYDELYLKYKP